MENATPAGGAVAHARRTPAPDAYDDVELLRWPDDEETLAARRIAGRATLLLVDPSQRPPTTWGPLEDWLREPFDSVDLYARREHLRRRLDAQAPAAFDDDGLLHRGRRWVALPPLEDRLVRVLLAHQDMPVARRTLVAALYPESGQDRHRALDSFIRRARAHLAGLGLDIHTVRGIGYMLEARELPA